MLFCGFGGAFANRFRNYRAAVAVDFGDRSPESFAEEELFDFPKGIGEAARGFSGSEVECFGKGETAVHIHLVGVR